MLRRAALVALLAASCGSQTKPCNTSTCMGCCDEGGECLAGTGVFECGKGGGMCVACQANEVCSAGACARFDGGEYDAAFPMDPDASFNPDAGVYDAGHGGDSGVPDGGRPDSGTPDAGRADAGMTMDAGRADAGVADAGRADAGFDAGAVDAGADAGDGG